MQRSEQIGKLATALAKAQGVMDDASKDSTNPHFRSKYADLASVRAAIRGPLSANGLAYVQLPTSSPDAVAIETMLMHAESGEFISETLAIPLAQKTAHAIGSAITYARRFSLMAILGIAPDEDDDGNKASERPTTSQRATPRPPAPPRAEPPPSEPIDEIPLAEPSHAQQAAAQAEVVTTAARQAGAATATVAKMAAKAAAPSANWKDRERSTMRSRIDPQVSASVLSGVLSDLADVSTEDELKDWTGRRQRENTRAKLIDGHAASMDEAFKRKKLLIIPPVKTGVTPVSHDPETGELVGDAS